MAQTIPQNAHRMFFFFLPKVAFTKDIKILNMAKVFETWHFCNIELYELNCQTLKTLFLPIFVIKMTFSRKLGGIHFVSSTCGQNMSQYGQILLPKQ